MVPDWSDLPLDLLRVIVAYLPIPDSLAFSAVCSSWRRAFASRGAGQRRSPQSPWLMLPGDADTRAKFFSLSDHRLHSVVLPTPAIRRRICVGSSHGWLITGGKLGDMHLLNPLTGVQIPLPSITAFSPVPFITRVKLRGRVAFLVDEWRLKAFMDSKPFSSVRSADRFRCSPSRMLPYFYRKAILDAAPSSTGTFTVTLIHTMCGRMAFAKAGDTEWTSIQHPFDVMDAIYHKGLLYTIASTGTVNAWHPDAAGRSFQPRMVVPRFDEDDDDVLYPNKYLAESPAGDMLLVLRDRFWEPGSIIPTPFKVSILDEQQRAWMPAAKGIGDAALFIGVNHAVCLSTRDCPELRASCVYFTDDDLVDSSDESRDIGVFDLMDGSTKPIDGLGQHLTWPPSVWITPALS